MIETIELSWLDFEKTMQKRPQHELDTQDIGRHFYRGHSDSGWHLETTLERYKGLNEYFREYLYNINKIRSEIETFTGRHWNPPSFREYPEDERKNGRLLDGNIIAYMIYLRHYGYPSPFLDWSLSPFVAAYFAFRDVSSKAESIAIYDFFAFNHLWKTPVIDEISSNPLIYPIDAASLNNRRHYLQLGVYTVCLKKCSNGTICFGNHEDTSIVGADKNSGEAITKYVIPASERILALHSLTSYNINAYSLMGTEESLLETMFLRLLESEGVSGRTAKDS